MKDCFQCHQLGSGIRGSDNALRVVKTPRELALRAGQFVQLTEERGRIPKVPWRWETGEIGGTEHPEQLHSWAFWTRPQCNCPACAYEKQYLKSTRPAFLFDLFNSAELDPQGTLVVSAVAPIQVTVRHRERILASKVVFTMSMTISPFEDFALLQARVSHVLSRWYKGEPSSDWEIENLELKPYKNAKNRGVYVPINSIGITEGYIIKTILYNYVETGEGRPLSRINLGPISKTSAARMDGASPGWDMVLGPGADLHQTVKKDPFPEYWNWEAAQFINVQILNTVAFESVTGLAAPATPISFEEYTKAGIPSMSYYLDLELSGAVGGKFPAIRTIGNIDSMLGVKNSVRLDPKGKPVGCVICERSICDSMHFSLSYPR